MQVAYRFTSPSKRVSFCTLVILAVSQSCGRQQTPWQQSSISVADPSISRQLLYGFYEADGNSWRWTGPSFGVALRVPPGIAGKTAQLHVQLYFPPAQIKHLGFTTLSAETGNYKYNQVTYEEGGPHDFVASVPAAALCSNVLPIYFFLDKFEKGSRKDARDLGVVVTSISLSATQ